MWLSWPLKLSTPGVECPSSVLGDTGFRPRGFEPRSSQSDEFKIDIYCFLPKHLELLGYDKDWLAQYGIMRLSGISCHGAGVQVSDGYFHK